MDTLSNAAATSLRALDTTEVFLDRICLAGDVSSRVGPRSFLHAGPPIELANMPGPMRGAVIGGLIFEGQATSREEAEEIIDRGEVSISPCHDAGAVGAMAGVVTPSMPVVVARSADTRTFSPLNEGTAGAVRYGSFDPETIDRLRWMSRELAPIMDEAIHSLPDLSLTALIAEGLRRGDDCHNRLVATSASLLAALAPAMVRGSRDRKRDVVAAVLDVLARNGHFALPFAISAAKAVTMAAAGVHGSPVVTTMSGNGREFGIRVSGLGDRWFLAPSPLGEPKLLSGATLADATPTMGDSMISETAGFGAFAMTAAPAIMSFVGGTAQEGRDLVSEMRGICTGTSSRFLIPAEEHRGTPLGIDVHKVADSGVAPVINNGMAHREPGRGRVGAGITRIPLAPFIEASKALRETGTR